LVTNISTDHILPAGPQVFTTAGSNVPAIAEYLFRYVESDLWWSAFKTRGGWVFVARAEITGQGASRETCRRLCPMFFGVKAVLAKIVLRAFTADNLN